MGKARKGTTTRKQTKATGQKKQVKENAAALNEPINFRERMIMAMSTARKIGFTLNLILIKVEVKYDHSFDLNFDARQMCVKNVMALPIHLILDKEEGKCVATIAHVVQTCV